MNASATPFWADAVAAVTRPAASPSAAFDIQPRMAGLVDLYAGLANVCLQLSYRPVGRGVIESKVESGSVLKHPVKRLRTTFSYLSVALMGDEQTRRIFRKAVNGQHRQVTSDENSPVEYDAFNPELQKWVAACLYKGMEDVSVAVHGPLAASVAEAFYQNGASFGTTLQMKRELWPADRAAFEEYWQGMVAKITSEPIDPEIQRFLRRVLWAGRAYGGPVGEAVGTHLRRMNIGFLPQAFRDYIGVELTAQDRELFDAQMDRVRFVYRHLPPAARAFPYNALLWDVKRRIRKGIALV